MIRMVLGGQYGSEGKGSVVSYMSSLENPRFIRYSLVIRSGSPNAGHTFYDKDTDSLYKMRQLPCTWLTQPNAPIYIPAGAVINKKVFKAEVEMVRDLGYKAPIWISSTASIINEDNSHIGNQEHGSTYEGVGVTRAAKCLRTATLVRDDLELSKFVAFEPHHILRDPKSKILIEGTQGFGLSIDGMGYPHCTSTNLTPYRILDDCEVPFGVHTVFPWLVFRTFPIRITGNSGFLFNETSWDALRELYGSHIPTEKTTVTNKVRRVGEFDMMVAHLAAERCNPSVVVLTFVDYLFPNIQDTGITAEVEHYLIHMESLIGRPINYIGVNVSCLIPYKVY